MSLTDDDLRRYLATAAGAATSTRDLLAAGARGRRVAVSQIGRDIKLDEDARSEALIRSYLTAASPFAVLGEESGWGRAERDTAEPHWVVDPLDGSFNFFRGVPLYAVSIALCIERRPLIGAIYDPERDELFSGGAGLGLTINGQGLEPEGVPAQMLATGFPAHADVETASARIASLAKSWTKVRMLGSAALSLAWVAAGRLDGYSESGILWWDVAAGLALARAAGIRGISVEPLEGEAVNVHVSR